MVKNNSLYEENRRIRRLQLLVNLTLQDIYQNPQMDFEEGLRIINQLRVITGRLFPGKEGVFDLIYKPRIMRALFENGIIKISSN